MIVTHTHIRIMAMAAFCAVVLCGCSQDESIIANTEEAPITFCASNLWEEDVIGGKPTTRLTTTGNTAEFEDEDQIGVYADYYASASATAQAFMANLPVKYTVPQNGTTGTWGYTPVMYWPTNAGSALSFYAYYPHTTNYPTGKTVNDGIVTFTINGKNDILWANKVDGKDATTTDNRHTSTSGEVNFGLRHLLNRIRIKFVQGEDFADGKKVTAVSITNAYSKAEMNVKTGELNEVASSPFANIAYTPNSTDSQGWAITEDGTETEESLYIGKTRNDVLAITAVVDGTDNNVEMPYTYNSADAGKSYLMTLRFMPKGIDVTLECVGGATWEGNFNWGATIR